MIIGHQLSRSNPCMSTNLEPSEIRERSPIRSRSFMQEEIVSVSCQEKTSDHDADYSNDEPDVEYWDTSEGDKYLNDIVLKLFGSQGITITLGLHIMEILKEFSRKCASLWSDRINSCKSISEAKKLIETSNVFDFTDYVSEHKIKSRLERDGLYSEPRRFCVRNEIIEYEPGYMRNLQHQGVIMDIEFQIKSFFELDGVLEGVIKYQNEVMDLPSGTYRNFLNGSTWKSIAEKYSGRNCIPIFLYNDDFQIDDKVGPHASVNSLSAFYYLFPSLPPHVLSKIDSIFLAMIVKAKYVKEYGVTSVLHCLTKVFCDLEEKGVTLFTGTPKETKIHFVMCKVIGDNLGLHCICGYRKTFNISHYCVTCEMPIDQCKTVTTIDSAMLRTVEKYNRYFEDGTAYELGLVEECVLNTIPSFHVIQNKMNDLMHDVQLGTIPNVLKQSLVYFKTKYTSFTLDVLNQRIKSFDCGEKEKKNIPGIILASHLGPNGRLHMNANESLFFLKHFPLITHDLLPTPDPIFQYILSTIDMIDKCYAPQFDLQSIQEMKNNIRDNKQRYQILFDAHLKPKDHNMLHYDLCVEVNGPLKHLSVIRAEAKHQEIKTYTNNCKSRRNICYSVAKKMAFRFAYFIATNKSDFLKKLTYVKENNKEKNRFVTEFISNQNIDFQSFISGK